MPECPARRVLDAAARRILADLGPVTGPDAVRVQLGNAVCRVEVWPARGGPREKCRRDILAVMRAAGRPLKRAAIVAALKAAGKRHGLGTVAKALADLTRTGELIGSKTRSGYRLPEPAAPPAPTLFDRLPSEHIGTED